MAHPTRLAILYRLAEEPCTVGELADALKLPISNISRHLRLLRDTMLVAAHHLGPTVMYELTDKRILKVAHLLKLVCVNSCFLGVRIKVER